MAKGIVIYLFDLGIWQRSRVILPLCRDKNVQNVQEPDFDVTMASFLIPIPFLSSLWKRTNFNFVFHLTAFQAKDLYRFISIAFNIRK